MPKKDSLGVLFFKEKQVKLITALIAEKEWHISDLAKEANVTYIHTSNFFNKCESLGITGSEKHGRIKRIFLTEKGREIAQGLSSISQKMNAQADQQQQKPQNGSQG